MFRIIKVETKRNTVKAIIEKDNSKILTFSVSLGRKIDGKNDVFTISRMLEKKVVRKIPEADYSSLAKAYFEPAINSHFFDLAVREFNR